MIKNTKVICPECEHELEFMVSYQEQNYIVGLFNCDNCGSAWKVKKRDDEIGEPEKYFFG